MFFFLEKKIFFKETFFYLSWAASKNGSYLKQNSVQHVWLDVSFVFTFFALTSFGLYAVWAIANKISYSAAASAKYICSHYVSKSSQGKKKNLFISLITIHQSKFWQNAKSCQTKSQQSKSSEQQHEQQIKRLCRRSRQMSK